MLNDLLEDICFKYVKLPKNGEYGVNLYTTYTKVGDSGLLKSFDINSFDAAKKFALSLINFEHGAPNKSKSKNKIKYHLFGEYIISIRFAYVY
jgi:hypothetical protein